MRIDSDCLVVRGGDGARSLILEQSLQVPVFHTQNDMTLQIFEDDTHPSKMSQARGKEGLSLFGVLDDTESGVGKKMLK